jgi:hypothetical protein
MTAFSSFSTTASANISINGISIAENCDAANINDAIRNVLVEGRQLYDLVAGTDTSSLMPKAGGAFTGDITRSGAGAYTYYVSSSLTGGKEYVQTTGTALPSAPAEGTKVFQY